MAMRKLHFKTKSFLSQHPNVGCASSVVMLIIGGIASWFSDLSFFVSVYFAFSIATIFRLITYKKGKIPFIMSDRTWDRYRLKYPQENAESKYKEMSIKRASIYFIISNITFVFWVIIELIILFLKLQTS